jgi:hypothetical protein
MAPFHVKRDDEDDILVTNSAIDLAEAEQRLGMDIKARDAYKELLDWGGAPAVKKETMLAKWIKTSDIWQSAITEDKKHEEELKKKVGAEPAREQDDEKAYKIKKTLWELVHMRVGIDMMIKGGDRLEGLRDLVEDHNVSKGEVLKHMRSQLLEWEKEIEGCKKNVEELRKKAEIRENRRELGVEALEKGLEEQGKDIGDLKEGVAKNTDDIKKNTERISRLESKPPTTEHSTPRSRRANMFPTLTSLLNMKPPNRNRAKKQQENQIRKIIILPPKILLTL